MVQDNRRNINGQIAAEVVAAYITGHCGMRYNEQVEDLAGIAEPFGQLVRLPLDIIAELQQRIE